MYIFYKQLVFPLLMIISNILQIAFQVENV